LFAPKSAPLPSEPEERAMPIDLDHIRESIDLEIPTDPEVVLQLADEVEHLWSKYTASQEALTELLTEHRKLCFVAEEVITCDECPDCSEIAREALGDTPDRILSDSETKAK
jgi:hypothetical protein